MYDFLMWLGNAFAIYRASQDAGVWFLQFDMDERQSYMESFLISRGIL